MDGAASGYSLAAAQEAIPTYAVAANAETNIKCKRNPCMSMVFSRGARTDIRQIPYTACPRMWRAA